MGRALQFSLCTIAFLVILKPTIDHTLVFLGLDISFEDETCYALMLLVTAVTVILFGLKRRLDAFACCFLALCAFVAASTIYNCGDLLIEVVDWLPCLATIMIVGAWGRREPRLVLSSFLFACAFYLICNLVYLLQDPELVGFARVDNMVFGYRNVTFRIAIPAFICALALDDLDGRAWSARSLTVFSLGAFEVMVGYSATSFCAFAVMALLVVTVRTIKRRAVLNALTYAIAYIAFFFALVVARVQNSLAFLIEPVLHRSVTFTGRTEIWDGAFAHLLNQHFITGYGTGYIWNSLSWNGIVQKHAHNDVLHALMLGGVGALIALGGAVGLSVSRLYRNRESKVAQSLSIGLAGFFVVSLAEVSMCPGFFFLLAFSFYYFSGTSSGAERTS